MKVFLAIIPGDYMSADVELCGTRAEAEAYIINEVDDKTRPYCSVQEVECPCGST